MTYHWHANGSLFFSCQCSFVAVGHLFGWWCYNVTLAKSDSIVARRLVTVSTGVSIVFGVLDYEKWARRMKRSFFLYFEALKGDACDDMGRYTEYCVNFALNWPRSHNITRKVGQISWTRDNSQCFNELGDALGSSPEYRLLSQSIKHQTITENCMQSLRINDFPIHTKTCLTDRITEFVWYKKTSIMNYTCFYESSYFHGNSFQWSQHRLRRPKESLNFILILNRFLCCATVLYCV